MKYATDDLRITGMAEVIAPAELIHELPLPEASSSLIFRQRAAIADIIHGRDPRLLVIVGPCSIHDPSAAMEYGRKLATLREQLKQDLLLVMRVYFEKPRTTVGWKGLINDPGLDNSFDIHRGLRIARKLLLDLAQLGLPAGTEYLDPITPQYVGDLVAWSAIGARTSESQVHRQLASGLSCPVGFKNSTDGSVQVAADAVRSAAHPHIFLSVTKQGHSAIFSTAGNDDCHIILRGGKSRTNFDPDSVAGAVALLNKSHLPPFVMIDASHGNSEKSHLRQMPVAAKIAEQVASGQRAIMGVMLESHLVAGRQDVAPHAELTYGQSITDACIDWDDTVEVLKQLATASAERRQHEA